MPDLSSIQLQARALDDLSQAAAAASAEREDAADRLTSEAQIKALLSVGAALRELSAAVRDKSS